MHYRHTPDARRQTPGAPPSPVPCSTLLLVMRAQKCALNPSCACSKGVKACAPKTRGAVPWAYPHAMDVKEPSPGRYICAFPAPGAQIVDSLCRDNPAWTLTLCLMVASPISGHGVPCCLSQPKPRPPSSLVLWPFLCLQKTKVLLVVVEISHSKLRTQRNH
jgi:hypothetical protein